MEFLLILRLPFFSLIVSKGDSDFTNPETRFGSVRRFGPRVLVYEGGKTLEGIEEDPVEVRSTGKLSVTNERDGGQNSKRGPFINGRVIKLVRSAQVVPPERLLIRDKGQTT